MAQQKSIGVATSDGKAIQEPWYDQLTPVQQERLRAAVRLMIEYLVDHAPDSAERELQDNEDGRQSSPAPRDGVSDADAAAPVQPPLPVLFPGDISSGA